MREKAGNCGTTREEAKDGMSSTSDHPDFPLSHTWLNDDIDGRPYWPTVADYLADLRDHEVRYRRLIRRPYRPMFGEARLLRRFLACLPSVQRYESRLSTADQTAFQSHARLLLQTIDRIATSEKLDSSVLVREAARVLSLAWCDFLKLCTQEIAEDVYIRFFECGYRFTQKARQEMQLQPDEVDELRASVTSQVMFEFLGGKNAADDRQPTLYRESYWARLRVVRLTPVLAARFGLRDRSYLADYEGRNFWFIFRGRAEQYAVSAMATPAQSVPSPPPPSTASLSLPPSPLSSTLSLPSPASAPLPSPPPLVLSALSGRSYSIADLLDMTGVSSGTLNTYAKKAGVVTPGRGGHNHRYAAEDVLAILRTIISSASNRAIRKRCQEALARLENPSEIANKSKNQK